MPSSICRLFVCVLLSATLAGCGGTSSTAPPIAGNPTVVTYTFNGPAPAAIATQIGTGPFTQATATAGKLALSIPQGESTFTVAFACPPQGSNPTSYYEAIQQASILDGTSFSGTCFANASTPQTGLATLQVNAAAIPGAQWVLVGGEALPWSNSTVDFSEMLPTGTSDLPVAVSDGIAPPYFGNYLALKILRSQTVPGALNSGNPLVFTTGDQLSPQTITYSNIPSGYSLGTSVEFFTAGGAFLTLEALGPPAQYLALPSASLQSGDYYQISASAQSAAAHGDVVVTKYTSAGGPQSFSFPAAPSYTGPTPAALPAFKLSYSGFAGLSPVRQFAGMGWTQGTTANYFLSIEATTNYQEPSALSIPDLSALAGFIAPAASGTTVNWDAGFVEGDPTLTTPPSGVSQSAYNYGSYTAP